MEPSWLKCRIRPDREDSYETWAWIADPELESQLESRLKEGQELWFYSSPSDHWNSLCGRGGYAIVEQGEVVRSIETVMN